MAALRRFDQLARLRPDRLAELAERLQVREARAGTPLVELGSRDTSMVYLLDGRVRLEAQDGVSRIVSHLDPAARNPLCRLRPARWRALAASAVRYLEIDDRLLEEFLNDRAPAVSTAGYSVSELFAPEAGEARDPEHGLLFRLYDDLQRDRLILPSPPGVAGNIGRRIAGLADSHGRIATLLMYDPALALKTLRAANVRLGPDRRVRSCLQAVAHLGGSAVHGLVAQSALLETFRPPNEDLAERILAWWERSLLASAIAFVLAGMTDRFDPQFAALVTLAQDVGTAAILAYAERDPDFTRDTAALDACVRAHASDAGRMLTSRWGLPMELAAAAAQLGNWWRESEGGADYTDLALVAQAHALLGSAETRDLPPIAQLPAARRLSSAGFDNRKSRSVLELGHQAVARARAAVLG